VAGGLAAGQGVGTILDNDTTPTLSIADASVEEGDTGTRQLVFTVTPSQPIARAPGGGFFPTNGPAAAPSDFASASGAVTFPGGATTRTVAVTINGDPTDEADETFTVDLVAPVGATVCGGQAGGTISGGG